MNNATKTCQFCGEEININAIKCKHCGEWLKSHLNTYVQYDILKKISNHQKISNILWLIIAILQICSVSFIIAGIWNLIGTILTWNLPKKIMYQDKEVPSYYEGIWGLIILAIVNIAIGGLIGAIIIFYDFYIRNLVLSHRDLFDKSYEKEENN